jgi:hypothetical protein
MPVLYILEAKKIKKTIVNTMIAIEAKSCQRETPSGIPNTTRLIMTTGEVNGIILAITASVQLGLLTDLLRKIKDKNIGIMMGIMRD